MVCFHVTGQQVELQFSTGENNVFLDKTNTKLTQAPILGTQILWCNCGTSHLDHKALHSKQSLIPLHLHHLLSTIPAQIVNTSLSRA